MLFTTTTTTRLLGRVLFALWIVASSCSVVVFGDTTDHSSSTVPIADSSRVLAQWPVRRIGTSTSSPSSSNPSTTSPPSTSTTASSASPTTTRRSAASSYPSPPSPNVPLSVASVSPTNANLGVTDSPTRTTTNSPTITSSPTTTTTTSTSTTPTSAPSGTATPTPPPPRYSTGRPNFLWAWALLPVVGWVSLCCRRRPDVHDEPSVVELVSTIHNQEDYYSRMEHS